MTVPPDVPPAVAPAARRDLPLLLGGAAVSTIGSSLTVLAVAVHVRPLGALWVAAALAAELVPVVLLAPVTGRLVDRVRNRELLLASLVLQAVGVLLAATVGLRPGMGWVLLAGLMLVGVGTSVTNPVIAALLPRVTGEEHATKAYGWYSMITQAGFLAGFALAGVLVELTSVRVALLLDAASFVLMAGAVVALRTQRIPAPSADEEESSVWLGFARIRQDRALLVGVVGLAAAILATVIVNVAEVFYVLDDIGAGPAAYGLVTALWPAAGILGGWYAGRLVGDRALYVALSWAIVIMGLALVLSGTWVSLLAVGAGWLVGGAANAAQRVAINALIRARTQDAERGRVFAAVGAVFQAGNLIGLAVGAAVVGVIGARSSLLLAGSVTALAGVVTWVAGRQAVPQSRGRIQPSGAASSSAAAGPQEPGA